MVGLYPTIERRAIVIAAFEKEAQSSPLGKKREGGGDLRHLQRFTAAMAATNSSAVFLSAVDRCAAADSPGKRTLLERSHSVRLVGTPVTRRAAVWRKAFGLGSNFLRRTISSLGFAMASAVTEKPPATSKCLWEDVEMAPEDPILGVTLAYNKDTSAVKLNLGVGAYRTEEGKPFVLESVRKAEAILAADRSRNKEYLPITGLAAFNKLSRELILENDCPALVENRVATIQCLSGTGSLRVGADFLAAHYPNAAIYLPDPTWGNHKGIFPASGLCMKKYRYYNSQSRGLDIEGMIKDLKSAPSGSVVLLHGCAHNPTGVDPLPEQWEVIRQVIRDKGHLPFFDCAYQGFASGDLSQDAAAVRSFAGDGGELLIAQSFAKNMGLYGERVGALSVVCRSEVIAKKLESQVKIIIRKMYSSPPIHGASIVTTVLGDKELREEWMSELRGMANRIIQMRKQLYDALILRETPGDWSHILNQIGMFTYSGLNKEQVAVMTRDYHVYMTSNGRISMAGLSPSTVPHLADAIHAAVTGNN
ncbi:hypothetical protein CBR_g16150 [Chara braunii]|uniref:Aspartate aminotransferase n=1 Tax=Chara braunii TaxID=69332 RepID=A0A388KTP1_CHABU|nr:hypothetical protein CBR_g16150 [Chara braunii]|eukprot:GBG73434.1 hypothetical protein CBR_g16150 [Chara braunii]